MPLRATQKDSCSFDSDAPLVSIEGKSLLHGLRFTLVESLAADFGCFCLIGDTETFVLTSTSSTDSVDRSPVHHREMCIVVIL